MARVECGAPPSTRPVVRYAYEVLSEPDQAVKAAAFMIQTGLLDQFRVVRSLTLKTKLDSNDMDGRLLSYPDEAIARPDTFRNEVWTT